jgi:hypothetical protein
VRARVRARVHMHACAARVRACRSSTSALPHPHPHAHTHTASSRLPLPAHAHWMCRAFRRPSSRGSPTLRRRRRTWMSSGNGTSGRTSVASTSERYWRSRPAADGTPRSCGTSRRAWSLSTSTVRPSTSFGPNASRVSPTWSCTLTTDSAYGWSRTNRSPSCTLGTGARARSNS